MKKLFITNEAESSLGNGVGTYIRQLITCLAGADISIKQLVFNSDKESFEIEEDKNVQYYYFPSFPDKSIQNHSLIIDKFFRLYIPDSSDNIFLINYSPFPLLMKAIRCSHPLSKQIYVIHDMAWTLQLFGDVDFYMRILKQQNKKSIAEKYSYILKSYKDEVEMCRLADKVVCLSEDTFRLLEGSYPVEKEKLCLIPNALDKQVVLWSEIKKKTFKEKMFLPTDEKIILYVGRLTEQKGFMTYIEAFKEIIKSYPACRLVVVGSTENWDCIRKFCYPVISKILFTGKLSADELKKWYQIADLGVLPSYTEQCSYVGLEMMAYGLPVVASDGFGVRFMFLDGENVKIAQIGKRSRIKGFKNELICSTLCLLVSEGRSEWANIRTKQAAKDNYTLENIERRYQDLFQFEKKCVRMDR